MSGFLPAIAVSRPVLSRSGTLSDTGSVPTRTSGGSSGSSTFGRSWTRDRSAVTLYRHTFKSREESWEEVQGTVPLSDGEDDPRLGS